MVARRRPRSRATRGAIGALALASGAISSCATDDDAATPSSSVPLTSVVLVGDSLGVEAAAFLPGLLPPGTTFVDQTFGGTAPCDWLDNDLGITPGSVTLISFVGNAGTPCMTPNGVPLEGDDLVDRYRADVSELIGLATASGSVVILVGQPANGIADTNVVVDRINEVYRDLAAETGVSFVDAGAAVETDDGEFAATLGCLPSEPGCSADGTIVVRSDDGLHFCPGEFVSPCGGYSSGAFRFAAELAAAAAGWEQLD